MKRDGFSGYLTNPAFSGKIETVFVSMQHAI